MPLSLDGVSITMNDRPAAVQFISPQQINALAPDGLPAGPVNVRITSSRGLIGTGTVQVRPHAPGFFTFLSGNRRFAAAVHLDGVAVADPDLLPGSKVRAAKPGETILLFGTGFGPTNPPVESAGYSLGRLPCKILTRLLSSSAAYR